MYLFFEGGLHVERFVGHHELLGDISLGSGLVACWRELNFADHQAGCVPKTSKKTKRELGLALSLSLYTYPTV